MQDALNAMKAPCRSRQDRPSIHHTENGIWVSMKRDPLGFSDRASMDRENRQQPDGPNDLIRLLPPENTMVLATGIFWVPSNRNPSILGWRPAVIPLKPLAPIGLHGAKAFKSVQ